MAVKKILVTGPAGDEAESNLDSKIVDSETVEPTREDQNDEDESTVEAAPPAPPTAKLAPSAPWSLAEKPSGRRTPEPNKSFYSAGIIAVLRGWLRRAVRLIKHNLKVVAYVGLAIIVVLLAMHIFNRPVANPLPKSLQQEANFTLYYPHSSVGKYKYVAGSGNYSDGKLTYNLGGAGGPIIHISEQALTVKAPDLHKLQGFSVFQTSVGQAAVYANGDVLNGVVIADKTLIILNGLGGVDMHDFTGIVNSLKP